MSAVLKPLTGLPVPAPNAVTEPFWAACNERRLVVQRCSDCGTFRHTPSALCTSCHSNRSDWQASAGTGTLFTCTVAHYPVHASLKDQLPYVVAVVQLDDCGGVRMTSNLVGCPLEEVRVGMKLRIAWNEVEPGVVLPLFRPA